MLQNLFKGRLNRRNFIVGSILLTIVSVILSPFREDGLPKEWATLIPALLIILAFIVLSYSLLVRRLHDVGKSGWYALLNIVPLINFILFLYLMIQKGEQKPNAYGTQPKPEIDVQELVHLRQ